MLACGLLLCSACQAQSQSVSGQASQDQGPSGGLQPQPTKETEEREHQVEEWDVEVLAEYPHDPQAYTQGLVFVGNDLWEGTGHYGASTLRRTEFQTGGIVQQAKLPDWLFGEGLAAVDNSLWQLTYYSGKALRWNRQLQQTATADYSGEGWGLCYDGDRLWMSNGTKTLQTFDAENFAYLDSVSIDSSPFPVRWLNELECVDGLIYANVYTVDEILVIDPRSRRVLAHVDVSALRSRLAPNPGHAEVLNGIAYHAERDTFFLTGKYWPKMFEVRFVTPTATPEAFEHETGG